MAEPFIGEIRIFAGNFAIRNWAFCDGQTLPIAQNTALFATIGTTFGGNGETTLGLPNLRGRAPMHPGNGPGLSPRSLGQTGGVTQVTLNANQAPPLPLHSHTLRGTDAPATSNNPSGALFAATGEDVYAGGGNPVEMPALASSGGGGPHNNMQPLLGVFFIIALVGTFAQP